MTKKIGLDKTIGGDKAHAVYSASGSSRWLNCPGSISLSEKAPPMPESPYAREGTEAHECLELILKNHRKLEAAEKMARKKYPSEMVDHVLDAVEWILGRWEAHPGADLLCETRVNASPFTCPDQFGTLDAAVVDVFGKLIVIDYKYGAGISVDPAGYDGMGNSQLIYYALGISYEYQHNFSDVELVVIQPRAYHESGEKIRTHTMSMKDFLKWPDVFLNGVIASQIWKNKFQSGEWCRFCPAAVICPEIKTNALQKAQIAFSDTNGVESVPEPRLVPINNLGTLLSACDQLEEWIARVREHAFHVLEKGGRVDGYKLVEKRATRKWADPEMAAIEAQLEFDSRAFTESKLLSPAQIESAFKGVNSIDEWVRQRTVKESSGVTLVKDDDKRNRVDKSEARFDGFSVIDVEVELGTMKQKPRRKAK